MKLFFISLLVSASFSMSHASAQGSDCFLIQKKASEAIEKGKKLSPMILSALNSCESAPEVSDVQALLDSVRNDHSVNRTLVYRTLGARAAAYILLKRIHIPIEDISFESESPNFYGDSIETLIQLDSLEDTLGLRRVNKSELMSFRIRAEEYSPSFSTSAGMRFGHGRSTNLGFGQALGELLMK